MDPVRKTRLHAIGEVAIRVHNMDVMVEFYNGVLGLPILRRFNNDVTALKIADGVCGHTQTLTLFGASLPPNHSAVAWNGLDHGATPLHHFAITIAPDDYEETLNDFRQAGIEVCTANHRWNGWRGIYVRDPEGNIVEFVSYHEDFDEGKKGLYDFGRLHGGSTGEPFV